MGNPEACPAFEPVDFQAHTAPLVVEFAQAHLALYRCWLRTCGQSQDTLGQAQMLKLLERSGLAGAGCLFPDRVVAQLWLSKEMRVLTEGAFGLNLPQFVALASHIGLKLLGAATDDGEGPSLIEGVIAAVNAGL